MSLRVYCCQKRIDALLRYQNLLGCVESGKTAQLANFTFENMTKFSVNVFLYEEHGANFLVVKGLSDDAEETSRKIDKLVDQSFCIDTVKANDVPYLRPKEQTLAAIGAVSARST